MNRQEIYRTLEASALSYPDYADVPVQPNGELLVPIPCGSDLCARQIGDDMRAYTGEQVFVREGVLERLGQAAMLLTEKDETAQLEVVYGYRALEIQTRLFEREKAKLAPLYEGDEQTLLAATHNLIAVPDVAGHPAGAAVDIQIVKDGGPLDFGTPIWSFEPDSFTFSPFVNKQARLNRWLLRSSMLGAGFAPFDGEWWHFSYGDKEWARYYGKGAAMYEQVEFGTE